MSTVLEILLVLGVTCCVLNLGQAKSLSKRDTNEGLRYVLPPPPETEEKCLEARMLRDLASQQHFQNSTRSVCKWSTKLNEMETRYPKILIEVGCDLTEIPNRMVQCETLYYNVPVAKLSFGEWEWELERIAVACVYARTYTIYS